MVLVLTLVPAQTVHSDANSETLPVAISKQVSFLSNDSNTKEQKVAVKAQEKPVEPTQAVPAPQPVPEPTPIPEVAPAPPTPPVDPNGCEAQGMRWRADNYECIPKPVEVAVATPAAPVAPSYAGGTKEQWMAAAGIPSDQWWAVDSIVTRESGWNPNAVNPNGGACGLGQQLPCGKWAGAWNDPVAALVAQYGYVTARYGGYPQAVAFWNANHWY